MSLSRKLLTLAAVMVAVTAAAQQGPTVSQRYRPGDPLHYRVTFVGDPSFSRVQIFLSLQGPTPPQQQSFSGQIGLGSELHRVSPGVYDVDGKIMDNVATGTYVLTTVQVAHEQQVKDYSYPKDFGEKIAIDVVNDKGYDFPPLKSVVPEK